jgi:CheY-like chemotaxis protein
MLAAVTNEFLGQLVFGLLAIAQLCTTGWLIAEKFMAKSEKKKRAQSDDPKGNVTRAEFQDLRTEFRELVSRFDLLMAERRRDMDFLMSMVGKGAPNVGRLKILLVEDSDNDRLLIRRALSPTFHIEEAGTLAQAFSLLDSNTYDCVLLDLKLPDNYGEETMRAFRARCPTAVSIVITGNADPKLVKSATDLGFESTIYKDETIDRDEFVRKISAAILRHRKTPK